MMMGRSLCPEKMIAHELYGKIIPILSSGNVAQLGERMLIHRSVFEAAGKDGPVRSR